MEGKLISVVKGRKWYSVKFESCEARLFVLNDHVFRYYWDPSGEFADHPPPHEKDHQARITVKTLEEYGTGDLEDSRVIEDKSEWLIETKTVSIGLSKTSGLMSIVNGTDGAEVLREAERTTCSNNTTSLCFAQHPDEFYFGGGTQNGRFSHKGKVVYVMNLNSWEDGGVASPDPFFWSSRGYGVLRHTWSPGKYDFRLGPTVRTAHEESRLDAYLFIGAKPVDILRDYYELTGKPVLLPEYAFYQSHFNAYNRDIWVEETEQNNDGTSKAVLFEDGKRYVEHLPKDLGNKQGILESLNGEKNNYQFSARAVVDRYRMNDMPLGWIIPNDGYGAGYGQSHTLAGDIDNLKEFVDYCELNGVKVGLWTESNLHPKHPDEPLKGERDIVREVRDAGVVALKTDEAWIGAGYSFGLSGIEDAATIFARETKGRVRPMILTIDGWAGTQRHAAVWTGDQTGGLWKNVEFHIPTFVGTCLSGQPNVGSDIDGIFGGSDREVNVRDYQWKCFTPIQINMDGWGANPKNPFHFDREATDINRAYLKLKSCLMPYNYSVAYEATDGLPMLRAMFLEYPNEVSAFTDDSKYQYMWGPFFLIAPIFNGTKDYDKRSIRDGVFLPDPKQIWIDFLTGDRYKGGIILNNLKYPTWKLPIFVKQGAIIPVTEPNNNPSQIRRDLRRFLLYPGGEAKFTVYEDDGISKSYLRGHFVTTDVTCSGPKQKEKGRVIIDVNKSKGNYENFIKDKYTEFWIMSSNGRETVTVNIGGKLVDLTKVQNRKEYDNSVNVFFVDDAFTVNKYIKDIGDCSVKQTCLLVKLDRSDVFNENIRVSLNDYRNKDEILFDDRAIDEELKVPDDVAIPRDSITPTSLTLTWRAVDGTASYDVERDGVLIRNILDGAVCFDKFHFASQHVFRVRSVRANGVSPWSDRLSARTLDDPHRNIVLDVAAQCNYPDQRFQRLRSLTVNDDNIWHTDWNIGCSDVNNDKFIQLKFDLGKALRIEKMEYSPRDDAGNGTILKLVYRTSTDDDSWSDYSESVSWTRDPSCKTVSLNDRQIRHVEIKILKSVGNFGSGKKLLFYKSAKL